MRIQVKPITLQLRHTFRIARNASDTRNNILIRVGRTLPDDSAAGLGEIVPYPYYGQTCELADAYLPAVSRLLANLDRVRSVADIDEMASAVVSLFAKDGIEQKRCNHVVAAVSNALLDHYCKSEGMSLGSFLERQLGQSTAPRCGFPYSSYTLGIDTPEVMREKLLLAKEFKIIKIKLGASVESDAANLRVVREATSATLRVDANGGWSFETAQALIPLLESAGVEFVEQPLPPEDADGYRRLRTLTRIPLFWDEGLVVAQDIERAAGVCDGVNLKLSKCGGLLETARLLVRARALGLRIMLGCMIESSVGLAAACELSPWVDFADLDGNLLISNDPYAGAANVAIVNGRVAAVAERPGLGFTDTTSHDWRDCT